MSIGINFNGLNISTAPTWTNVSGSGVSPVSILFPVTGTLVYAYLSVSGGTLSGLKIGTTNGGSELMSNLNSSATSDVVLIGYYAAISTPVYFTGYTGTLTVKAYYSI